MYTNAHSIVNKMNEMKAVVAEKRPDVLVITETWTNELISNEYLRIAGYELIERKDRNDTDKGRGGGICIYAKKDVYAWNIETTTNFNQTGTIRIKCKKTDIDIHAIYRSPNSTKTNDDELNKWIRRMRGKFILIGDFNYPDIRWNNGTAGAKGRQFYEAVCDRFLEQHVNEATHDAGNILDLILSSHDELVSNVKHEGKIGNSDHEVITCVINTEECREKRTKQFRDFKRANIPEMRGAMQKDWRGMLTGKNVNEAWSIIKQSLNELIENHVPLRTRTDNNDPKWYDRDVKKKIGEKKAAWIKWKKSKLETDKREYKKREKETKKTIKNKKNGLERRVINNAKTNPKGFYSYLNSAKRTKAKIGPLKSESEMVINPQCQATILNNYFSSVFTRSDVEPPRPAPKEGTNKFTDIQITEEKIEKIINGLRDESAPGPDGFPPKLLKMIVKELLEPLKILFRKSIDEGTIPDDWRDANVTPIHKKGTRADPGNYRGINLTPSPGKVMERMVKDGLDDHVESNGLMTDSQHGFRRSRSAQTNLIEFFDKMTKWLDDGRSFDVLYLDFAKAFDKVCHRRLLIKLEEIGVDGKMLEWISDWLKNRRQRVGIDGNYSDWATVDSGVLQGSVLGGILFNIFNNDLDPAAREAFIRKFADDCKVARIVETEEDADEMQETIDELNRWAATWEMAFNVSKCKIMHFGNKNPKREYFMNGEKVEVVSEEKDLGVWVLDTLKPTKQCEAAAKAAHGMITQIGRAFHYRKAAYLIPLYKTFIRPKLEYAVAAWSPWTVQDIETLESVQRRVVRMISDRRGNTYEQQLQNLGLTTLAERRIRGDVIQAFKVLNGMSRVDKNEWFNLRENEEIRSTRANTCMTDEGAVRRENVMHMESVRLETRKNFFNVRVAKEWNRIPDRVKNQQSINAFKNAYDKWNLEEKQRNNTN